MNPKLIGSNIIDCIPQTGECPNRCGEEFGEDCFYNGGRFYRTLDDPLFPRIDEAMGKIVRVNSGHDSNLQRDYVVRSTSAYPERFFNTSIPNLNFPAPVVFTCNGREFILVKPTRNLMFVRVRTSLWNLADVDKAVEWYQVAHKVAVVLTFMRYYKEESIPSAYRSYYEKKEHVLNTYWCLRPEGHLEVLGRYKGKGIRMCGTPVSSLCVDCRNCELLYWANVKDLPNNGWEKL